MAQEKFALRDDEIVICHADVGYVKNIFTGYNGMDEIPIQKSR